MKYIVRSDFYYVINLNEVTPDRTKARWFDRGKAKWIKAELNRRTNPKTVWFIEKAEESGKTTN